MLNKNSSIEKINKEIEKDSNPEKEKLKTSSLKDVESRETNFSSLNSDFRSENSADFFSPFRKELSSQPIVIQGTSKPIFSLTQKFILSSFSDQKSTKILQNILMKEASKENIDTIVNELIGTYRTIMKNKNGNYFCSSLFEVCNQQQRLKILKEITKYISEDSVDFFATVSYRR